MSSPDMTRQLESAPIGRLFFKLAIPTVLAQLVNLLYNIVDRIYLGHMPGTGSLALTGVGICFPIICLISAFSMLIGQGGSPRASIALGEKNNKKASKILGNCMALLIICAVLLTSFIWLFGEKLLWAFGASENTIVYALPYMRIYGSGTIFVLIALGLNLFITAQGFTKYSMITVVVGAVCNIVLDPILIFAFHMGVYGAAIATVISQIVSSVLVIRFLFGKKTLLPLKKEDFFLDARICRDILSLGISPFIMSATEAAINVCFNYSLQKYGGDVAVGVMTIASTVNQMVFIPIHGIAAGAQPLISYSYGAKNKERFLKTVRLLLIVCLSATVVLCTFVELFPQFFASIFGAKGEILDMCKWALRVYMASMTIFGIQNCVQQTFVSTGQAAASLFIACLRKVILLIPLIFIFPLFITNKVLAVFLAEPVADGISVITAATIFAIKLPKILKTHFTQ